MPQSEELSPAMQAMKRELLAAIAAVDAKVELIDVTTRDTAEKVQFLCDTFMAPGDHRVLKQARGAR